MRDIVFVGRQGSGKTTIAKALEDQRGYTRLSFAAPVKIQSCRVYNLMSRATTLGVLPPKEITPKDLEEDKETYRKLMQVVGTELGRELFGEDVWVEQLLQKMAHSKQPIVVDDARFRNELTALLYPEVFGHRANFYPIYLTRTTTLSDHSSEAFTQEEFETLMTTIGKMKGKDFLVLDNAGVDVYTSIEAVLTIADTI